MAAFPGAGERAGLVRAAPSVRICGECHPGQCGPRGDAAGRVRIRDLHRTVPGNPTRDVDRHGLSLSTARGSDSPGTTTAHQPEELVRGCCDALLGRGSHHAVTVLAACWTKGRPWVGTAAPRRGDGHPGNMKAGASGSGASHCLIGIEEAVASVAPRGWARRPRPVARLRDRRPSARLLGRPVVMGELMLQGLKLEIDQLTREGGVGAARFLAAVIWPP